MLATLPMGVGLYIMVEVGKVRLQKVEIVVLPMLIPLVVVLFAVAYFPGDRARLPNIALGQD
tara:strand:+ start:794 stop:979 length:186 start_codon:yes stop_codon:yes gene_type:complete